MKYVSPEVEFLELDLIDIIQTSTTGEGEEGGYKDNELPMN